MVQNGYLKIGVYFAHLLSAAAAYLLARHRPASLTQASLLHFAPLPHDSTAVAATALSAALEGATSITAAFISHWCCHQRHFLDSVPLQRRGAVATIAASAADSLGASPWPRSGLPTLP